MEEDNKTRALAAFLDVDMREIDEKDGQYWHYDDQEYMVLTDDEADEAVTDYIKDSLWAFNASFLSRYTGLPQEDFEALADKCEDSNEAVLACVEQNGGLDGFIEKAISADGRGHFLSGYDGQEEVQEVKGVDYWIYRTN